MLPYLPDLKVTDTNIRERLIAKVWSRSGILL